MNRDCTSCKYEFIDDYYEPCKSCTANGKFEHFEKKNRNVDHPSHYCRDGAMESIEEMVEVFGAETVSKFCLCNVWKYRYRASDKNGKEDIAKSDWYMKKYVELKKRLNENPDFYIF